MEGLRTDLIKDLIGSRPFGVLWSKISPMTTTGDCMFLVPNNIVVLSQFGSLIHENSDAKFELKVLSVYPPAPGTASFQDHRPGNEIPVNSGRARVSDKIDFAPDKSSVSQCWFRVGFG